MNHLFMSDRGKYICELQNRLRMLYRAGYDLPSIVEDGVYGDRMRAAVTAFQRALKLPETGRMDQHTFDTLVKESDRVRDAGKTLRPALFGRPKDGRILPGEVCDQVAAVRQMLTSLEGFADLAEGGKTYDPALSAALARFREAHLLPPDDCIDAALWNELVRTYNAFADFPDANI